VKHAYICTLQKTSMNDLKKKELQSLRKINVFDFPNDVIVLGLRVLSVKIDKLCIVGST
jgi:hypothetical protein